MNLNRLIVLISLFFSLFVTGCEDADVMLAADAGLDAVKAITLTDESVQSLAAQASRHSDHRNTIAPSDNRYSRRLQKLTGGNLQTDGYTFNFKVYLTPEINAFAMADGTIRIYSGLMDMMDDSELLFVVGHEMGHVVKKHINKKMRFAYAASAVRKGAASLRNEIGALAGSQLGAFAENLLNAQFSQQEEREADDYGFIFLKNSGHEPKAAVSALKKLATLGNNHSFLSSHPAPAKRAKRLEKQI